MTTAVQIVFEAKGVKDIDGAIATLGKSLDRLAKAGMSASERSVRARISGEENVAKAGERASKAQLRSVERAAREEASIRNKINSLELREYAKSEREKTRAAASAARDREQIAKKEAGDVIREHERAARHRASMARTFGQGAGGIARGALGMAGRLAATVGAIGGGFAIADSLRAGIDQEKQAGVIFRGATKTGGFANQGEVQQLAKTTAIKTGGTTDDVLGGLDMFVRKTGDLKAARDMLEDMAKLSAATGTNFQDMGNTTAEVYNQLNDTKQTMEVMRALAGQGKAGAIDIKDLGQYGGRLAASAAQFSGSLSGNIESFGAIAQLSKKLGGATDTAEATESVARLSSDFAKHQSEFRAKGIEVFSDKSHTKFRNAEDIITEAVVKTKGDEGVLHGLFGERSIKAALGAQVAFSNAGGGAAGEAAIREQFAGLKSTTLSKADVDTGAKARMEELDAKVNTAMEQFHNVLNERLLPKLPQLIDKFIELIPAIEKFIDLIISHPYGTIIGGAIVAQIAKAGIAQLVASSFSGIASGVLSLLGIGAAAAPGAAAAGSALAAGGAAMGGAEIVGGAAAAGGAGALGGVATVAGGMALPALGVAGILAYGAHEKSAGEDVAKSVLAMGEGTPEQAKAKAEAARSLIARVKEQQSSGGYGDDTGGGEGDEFAMMRNMNVKADARAEGASTKLGELESALESATKSLQNFAQATSTGLDNPGHSARGGQQQPQ